MRPQKHGRVGLGLRAQCGLTWAAIFFWLASRALSRWFPRAMAGAR